MKRFSTLIALAVFTLLMTSTVWGQLTGTKTIPGDYASLSAAITDLNSSGVGSGGVTFNVAAGYTETIAATLAITATGTSGNPIVFQKSGVGANPLVTAYTGGTGTPSSAVQDGIWNLVGSDYVTIDGIDLTDNAANTTNPSTMEHGYALYKASTTDGCQYVTIKNCTITLNRINNASGSGPSVEGSRGIEVTNATPAAATTALVPTDPAGSNSYNQFYANTIQNSNYGIVLSGYAATTPFTLGDTGNDVGGSSALTGNTILNYGGAAAATNPAAGIRANNQWSVNISYNTINNNNGSGANHVTTLRGIYAQAGTSANATISHNTITVQSAATTSALTAIENAIGSTAAGNTVTITNNVIQNCTYATATTGTFSGILNSATAATVNMDNNTVTGNTVGTVGTASACTFQGVYSSGSPTTLTLTGNTVTNNQINNQGGTMYCLRASTSLITANSNTINNNSIPSAGGTITASIYGYYDAASATSETYTNNAVDNLSISGSSTSTSCIIYGIYSFTVSSSTVTMSGNTVHTLTYSNSSTGAAAINGLRNSSGGTVTYSKNKVYNLTSNGASSTVYGMYIGSGAAVTASNNLVGDVNTPSANAAVPLAGINVAGGTAVNLYYNTVYVNGTSTGALFGNAAVYASTTPTLTMRNNVFVNTSTPAGAGFTSAYRRTSATLTSYASASNNNDFYAGAPSGTNLIFYDGTNADSTLSAYKARVAPRDAGSITENPTFVSTSGSNPNFLHINISTPTQIESGAQPVGAVTDDYDGDARNVSTPDIGADEFLGVVLDLTAPNISYTPLGNISGTTQRNFTNVTITDPSGVNTTAGTKPRVYYKRFNDANTWVDNTNGTNGWKYVEANGSSSPFDFTLDYSKIFGGVVVVTDTIQYFVVAQDLAATPNVGIDAGSFTATPTSVALTAAAFPIGGSINQYKIVAAPLSGDYTVGLALFNQVTGKNISFERVTRTVIKDVLEPVSETGGTAAIDKTNYKEIPPVDQVTWKTVRKEVEEISWAPLDNGTPYSGPLYLKRTDHPELPALALAGVYATITAAVADLNERGVSGPTRFLLTDATYPAETFPITVNINNASLPTVTNTVTIKPNTGVTTAVSGAAAAAVIFKVFNTHYVTIDGSNTNGGTTRDLTIENTSTTTPSVVWFGSSGTTPITNGTLKNCVVRNGVITSSAVVISDGTTLGSAGYFSDMTIQNNSIMKAYIGVYSTGGTIPQNGANLTYTQNNLDATGADNIRLAGLYMQGVNGATVTQNTIGNFDAVSAENDVGIWLATGSINATIANNIISNLGYTGTSSNGPIGINVTSTLAGSNDVVRGNTVSNLSTNGSTSTSGISSTGTTSDVTIEKNDVHGIFNGNTGTYGAYGINVSGGNNFTVANNFVSDINHNMSGGAAFSTTFGVFGIRVGAGTGHKIYYNSVNLYGPQTGTPASSLLSAAFAIALTTQTGCDVRNNVFANTESGGTTSLAHVSVFLPSGGTSAMNLTWDNNAYFSGSSVTTQGLAQVGTTAGTGFYLAPDFDPGSITPATNFRSYSSTLSAAGTNDHASFADTVAAPFTSAQDLHIPVAVGTLVSNGGTPVSVTDDIDGDTRSVTTPDIGADEYTGVVPAAFAMLSPANGASSVPVNGSLVWETSQYAATYDVYLDTAAVPVTIVAADVTDTTYVYSLNPLVTYYWKVVAKNGNGNTTATGAPFSFTTAVAPPDPPTNFSMAFVGTDSMYMTWTDNANNEDGYRVFRASAPGGPFSNVSGDLPAVGGTGSTGSFGNGGLAINAHYYYRVVAFRTTQGESSPAAADSVTLAATPGAPTFGAVTFTTINVRITKNGNPDSSGFAIRIFPGSFSAQPGGGKTNGTDYYVQADGTVGTTVVFQDYTQWGGASGKTVTGLTSGVSYTFDVRARNANQVQTNFGPTGVQATSSAPVISVATDSLTFALLSGQVDSAQYTIRNTGLGSLTITAIEAEELSTTAFKPLFVQEQKHTPSYAKGTSEPSYAPVTDGMGGPDPFGYKWIDSDEPNGPPYVWNDISGSGTNVTTWVPTSTFDPKDEGYAGPFDLGFNFTFYGQNYSQVWVSSNGLLELISPTATNIFTNAAIPASAYPNGIICPFWDDLDGSAAGTVHYQAYPGKFVIQFTGWQFYPATGTVTMQVVLYSGGKVEYYYNTLTGTLTGSTVGMENETGTIGTQIAFNQAYVHNSLAVRISRGPTWLSQTPTSGTVAPGDSLSIKATVNATGLMGGLYRAEVHIASNDPITPTLNKPIVHLQVTGAPDIGLSPTSLDYGTDYINIPDTLSFDVNNTGTDVLHVTNMTHVLSQYTVLGPTSFDVPVAGHQTVGVKFVASTVGTFVDSVTITSDATSGTIKLPLHAVTIAPPVIALSDTALTGVVDLGATDSTSFVIRNVGLSDLTYSIIESETPLQSLSGQSPIRIVANHTAKARHAVKNTGGEEVVAALPHGGGQLSAAADVAPQTGAAPVSGRHTDATFDLQFNYDAVAVTGAAGNAAAVFVNGEFWTSRWASNVLHRWNADGTLIEQFTISGVTGVRGLTTDGTYLYGSSSLATIFQIDPVSKTLVGTITCQSGVTTRMITYDPVRDGFWTSNFTGNISCVNRSGAVIATIPSTLAAKYGSAYDPYTPGGPYLWVFDQTNTAGGIPQNIWQFDLNTLQSTGVSFDIYQRITNAGDAAIAGGLFITDELVPGKATIGGLMQGGGTGANDRLFGLELAPTGFPWVDESPTEGTISAGDSASVKVYWNGVLPTEDVVNGYLSIASNDLTNPVKNIHLTLTIVVGIDGQNELLPTKYELHANYPNPFNPTTTIKYDLKESGRVTLKVYNILGQEVRTLFTGTQTAGYKLVVWDGRNNIGQSVSSGIYIFRLEAGNFVKSRKMMLLK